MTYRFGTHSWTWTLVACWALLAIWSNRFNYFPDNYWFKAISLSTTTPMVPGGKCQNIEYELKRKISHEFYGTWVTSILRRPLGSDPAEEFVTYRAWSGANDYRPENKLPEPLTLCWLIFDDDVVLPPGEYKTNIRWIAYAQKSSPRFPHITSSNYFVVPE